MERIRRVCSANEFHGSSGRQSSDMGPQEADDINEMPDRRNGTHIQHQQLNVNRQKVLGPTPHHNRSDLRRATGREKPV